MPILKATARAISDSDTALNRVFPVTAKLTKEELGKVTEFARSQGLARGEWIRDVILKEMREASASDPSLAEILGVRLLLVNVLRPLAAGQRPHPAGVRQTPRRNQQCKSTNSLGSWLFPQEGNRQWK